MTPAPDAPPRPDPGSPQEPWDAPAYTCPLCRRVFAPTDSQRKNRRAKSVTRSYCSADCRTEAVAAGRRHPTPPGVKGQRGPVRGPCATCGDMFRSFGAKIYCTFACYRRSPHFAEHLVASGRERAERQRRAAGHPDPGNPNHTRECPGCGNLFEHPWKRRREPAYCSRPCFRNYYATRFDRFVANPETIALPQCFDEFLTQEELPCVVEGCGWAGKNLSIHCNHHHGITAAALKEILGFNRGTGLVVESTSRALSEREGMPGATPEFLDAIRPAPTGEKIEVRLEAREHLSKATSFGVRVIDPDKPPRACLGCQAPVPQPVIGLKKYCSLACRSAHYLEKNRARGPRRTHPMVCGWCRKEFMGTTDQMGRVQRGLLVFCTRSCSASKGRAGGP